MRVGIKGADAFDFIVEQVDTEGQGRAHGVKINQATADAVFAGSDDLRDMFVTSCGELSAQGFDIEAVTLLEEEGVRGEILRRCQAGQGSTGSHHQQITLAAHDGVERGEAF